MLPHFNSNFNNTLVENQSAEAQNMSECFLSTDRGRPGMVPSIRAIYTRTQTLALREAVLKEQSID